MAGLVIEVNYDVDVFEPQLSACCQLATTGRGLRHRERSHHGAAKGRFAHPRALRERSLSMRYDPRSFFRAKKPLRWVRFNLNHRITMRFSAHADDEDGEDRGDPISVSRPGFVYSKLA
jgi:hypothetical protein